MKVCEEEDETEDESEALGENECINFFHLPVPVAFQCLQPPSLMI